MTKYREEGKSDSRKELAHPDVPNVSPNIEIEFHYLSSKINEIQQIKDSKGNIWRVKGILQRIKNEMSQYEKGMSIIIQNSFNTASGYIFNYFRFLFQDDSRIWFYKPRSWKEDKSSQWKGSDDYVLQFIFFLKFWVELANSSLINLIKNSNFNYEKIWMILQFRYFLLLKID